MREPLNRVRAIKARILLLNEIISDFGGDISRALLDEKVFKPAILIVDYFLIVRASNV